jgi:hypothetical protein
MNRIVSGVSAMAAPSCRGGSRRYDEARCVASVR